MTDNQFSVTSARNGRPTSRHRLLIIAHWSFAVLAALVSSCALPGEEPLPDGMSDNRADLVGHIRDNPNDIDAHADLLRMQIKSGDVEGAMATVSHVLKHNERDFRAHLLDAQFQRWQLNLLGAEAGLRKARDIAPERLEPCVALAGLYNQSYLQREEVRIREIAAGLAPVELRAEFLLDLGLCHWQVRDAERAATLNADDAGIPAAVRARALVMRAEMALGRGGSGDAAGYIRAAFRLDPENTGILQFAARAVTVLDDPAPLGELFDETLAGKDRAELRWTALFGHWMLAVRKAADSDPLAEPVERWRLRLEVMEPGHPDVAVRYLQLLRLRPEREAEAKQLEESLNDYGLGTPPAPDTQAALLALWRAEDALRTGAPSVALATIARLEETQPDLEGLRLMRIMALFVACDFALCLEQIDRWLAESGEADEMLLSTRWVILLRLNRPADVLADIRARELKSNAARWFEAVANFHTYRQR